MFILYYFFLYNNAQSVIGIYDDFQLAKHDLLQKMSKLNTPMKLNLLMIIMKNNIFLHMLLRKMVKKLPLVV